MVRIGELLLPHGLMLAPMAGYADYATRRLSSYYGAEYCISEMVSAKAVCYGDKKTPALARIFEEEAPCAIQLFGSEPDFLAEAARRLSCGAAGGRAPAAIDINMGCPVHKVAGNGEGSALMKNPKLVEKIVAAVKGAVSLPVTVKIRAGWDSEHKNAPEVARAAEAGGASLICVHGRTRAEMYSGRADLAIIRAVKGAVAVPVIGNGDIVDGASALTMLQETGCDGLMVGRGAVGNPFVFREILDTLEGRTNRPPSGEERYRAACMQLAWRCEEKGEHVAVAESRKQLSAFLRGFPASAVARAKVHAATEIKEMQQALSVLLTLDRE